MTKNELTLNTSETTKLLKTMAQVESTLKNCNHIVGDMGYAINDIKEIACCKYIGAEYYIAIRDKGVENGAILSKVVERCSVLGQPYITIKLVMTDKSTWSLVINRK